MYDPEGENQMAPSISTTEGVEEEQLELNNGRRKYKRLARVYSDASIRKNADEPAKIDGEEERRRYTYVYSRRDKRKRKGKLPFLDQIEKGFPEGYYDYEEDEGSKNKKRRVDGGRSQGKISCRSNDPKEMVKSSSAVFSGKVRKNRSRESGTENQVGSPIKKWVGLSSQGVDPLNFVGLQCQVYWPLDACWYDGQVVDFDSETGRHKVKYEDDEDENLILSNERIKFYVSFEEMQDKNLKVIGKRSEADGVDVDELMVLAASLDVCDEIESGDVIWAKLTGHAIWPAIVLNESHVRKLKGLNKSIGEKSVPVQFFGTHDFARVRHKQAISFLKGLFSSYHLKCRKPTFLQGLEEAKMYLSEQRLPEVMLQLQDGVKADMNYLWSEETDCAPAKDEEFLSNDEIQNKLNEVSKLVKEMTGSRSSVRFTCSSSKKTNSSVGYRQVNVQWRDLDKCNVCHMDEEYETNLFLQCDKCRMMVHARCYGELEPTGGDLWLCNLCRPESPESPRCCLCPITGGAMKPTSDGRWAHLACAIWIPETWLADIKKMEPIDGLHRISKNRWKLLCSICDVSHGACIQCSNPNCRVAYHPLCARAAGFCLDTEDMDSLRMIPFDEDEESQHIQLISFCRKHRPSSSNEQSSLNRKIGQKASSNADYVPLVNPSGCARTEPYNFLLRRGRKEPEVLAASSKRFYVENKPYLLGGSNPHMPLWNRSSSDFPASKHYRDLQKLRIRQLNPCREIISVADKYNYMRETFRKRLAFGKSGIHGYGVFAKLPHRAGDMVIEYTGEIIRPRVADRREHLIYNSLVGAGTYMFRIDDDRVIDATKAGSIAHLINHSCEPNCYSRVISVVGENHIIIFAKRDIKQWEELTYDYRFLSADERLPCFCGASRCRGVVNDTEAEERVGKICVPSSEVVDWRGE